MLRHVSLLHPGTVTHSQGEVQVVVGGVSKMCRSLWVGLARCAVCCGSGWHDVLLVVIGVGKMCR